MNPRSSESLRLALAVAVGEMSGSELCLGWQLELGRMKLCELGAYPEHGVCLVEDCVAAVVVGMEGPHCGCGVLALEPKPALRWIEGPRHGELWQPGDAQAALERYLASAGAVAQAISRAVVPGARFGSPRLVEQSLPAALVATHAPRDTMLLSAELQFVREDERLTAHACVLLDAKLLARGAQPAPD